MSPAGTNSKKGRGSGGKVSAATSSSNAMKKRAAASKTSPSKGSSSNINTTTNAGNNNDRNNTGARKSAAQSSSTADSNLPTPAYLISCDVPTKQYILYLNEQILGGPDKKFILQDLDATHLLIKPSARAEIDRKLDIWFDENIFSAIEKVGEDFDVS
jgi:Transcription factor TFIIH complex subunit Tfb5